MDDWIHSNAAGVSIYEVGKLLAQAFLKIITPVNIISGSKSTGIHPINSLIFGDHEFSPSTVTDQLMLNNKAQSIEAPPPPPLFDVTNVELTTPKPSTLKVTIDKRVVTPAQLLSLPKAAPKTKSIWRKVFNLNRHSRKTENRKRA